MNGTLTETERVAPPPPPRARVQALRGAITLREDSAPAMREAVTELLHELLAANDLAPDYVISAFFSVTPDIRSIHPATAARAIGWDDVPMLCVAEMDVDGALPLCVRVLLHVELANGARARHVYLREAVGLRPDLGE